MRCRYKYQTGVCGCNTNSVLLPYCSQHLRSLSDSKKITLHVDLDIKGNSLLLKCRQYHLEYLKTLLLLMHRLNIYRDLRLFFINNYLRIALPIELRQQIKQYLALSDWVPDYKGKYFTILQKLII